MIPDFQWAFKWFASNETRMCNLLHLLDLWYPVTEFFRKECESKESADPVADKVAALYSEKRFHRLSIFGLLLVMEVLTWTER